MTFFVRRGGVSDPSTQARVAVWTDTAGTFTVTVGGSSQSVTISDASNYLGIEWLLFTGLTPGTSYTGTASDGTTIKTFAARMVPSSGAHKMMMGSCYQQYMWHETGAAAMLLEQAHLFIPLGDLPYCDNLRQMTNSPTAATLRGLYWSINNRASFERMLSDHALYPKPSDHDYQVGNDAPGRDDYGAFSGASAANYWHDQNPVYPTTCASEAEWIALLAMGATEYDRYYKIPVCPDTGVNYGSGAVPTDAVYTRFTVGQVEYFLVDQFRYCEYRNNTGITNRSMLGAIQLSWLLARLALSTAKIKALMFAQNLLWIAPYSAGARNDYGHLCYSDEAEVIKDALTDTSGWTVPGGVVVFSGDVHTPFVLRCLRGEGFLQITPCPSGIDYVAELPDLSTDSDTQLLWREKYPSGGEPKAKYYGLLDDPGTGAVTVSLRDNLSGIRWSATLAGGDNAYSYRRTKV